MGTIAIIGTAGRDKGRPMRLPLWHWMVEDAKSRVPAGSHLVSGGAAWADHLAVELFLSGHAAQLTLHFPAPFDRRFEGPPGSSASAANFYHTVFSRVLGCSSLVQISRALLLGADHTFEPPKVGYGGMSARNLKVAKSDEMLAYTFGTCGVPADGGTKNTWSSCRGRRTHVQLPYLEGMS